MTAYIFHESYVACINLISTMTIRLNVANCSFSGFRLNQGVVKARKEISIYLNLAWCWHTVTLKNDDLLS